MSFSQNSSNSASSSSSSCLVPNSSEVPQSLPKSASELKLFLNSSEKALGLVVCLNQNECGEKRWSDRQPLCAKILVETLFSKKKMEQVIVPFFALCAKDPGLKKAFIRMGSQGASEKNKKVLHAIKATLTDLAEQPDLFFELAEEAVHYKQSDVAFSLLEFCRDHSEFVKENRKLFCKLIHTIVKKQDIGLLEYVLGSALKDYLEKEKKSYDSDDFRGGIDLFNLINYKLDNVIELLLEKGLVKGMPLASYLLTGDRWFEWKEKVNLLIANGAIVEKPRSLNAGSFSYFRTYSEKDRSENERTEKAYLNHEFYNRLHSSELTEEYLRSVDKADLWYWLCYDRHFSEVLVRFPHFFKEFFIECARGLAPNFEMALKALIKSGIFDVINDGVPLLFQVIDSEHYEWAKTLIDHSVPFNQINAKGHPCLEAILRSVRSQKFFPIELLDKIINDPQVDCRLLFSNGMHVFDYLLSSTGTNKHEVIQLLLQKAINPVTTDAMKTSLLQLICKGIETYDVPALKLLISAGMSLKEKSADGKTVLHELIEKQHESPNWLYLELIRHIAIKEKESFDGVCDNQGLTALDLAKKYNLSEVVLTLLQVGLTQSGGDEIKESEIKEFESEEFSHPNRFAESDSRACALIAGAYQEPKGISSKDQLQSLLTLKNLCHLFGDAISKGQTDRLGNALEGNPFSHSIELLMNLLSICQTRLSHVEQKQKINFASSQLKNALYVMRLLEFFAFNELSRQQFLPILSACIEDQITRLSAHESLLLPCGWVGLEGDAHAMLLQIVKNIDGTLSLFVINTGSGVGKHATRPTPLKDLINPVRAFCNIPQEKLFDQAFIPAILAPRTFIPEDGKNRYKAKDIYHMLFHRFENYAASLPEDRKLCFITAQRSGTCTIRSLLTFVHLFLSTPDYKMVKIELDAMIFEAINDKDFIFKSCLDPTFIHQLEHAVQRSALQAERHLISRNEKLDEAEKIADLLEEVESKIVAAKDAPSQPLWERTVDRSALPLFDQVGQVLEPVRQKLVRCDKGEKELAPGPNLPFSLVDFSKVSSAEEWFKAIDDLNSYFSLSSQSGLHANRELATKMTTYALMTLQLPTPGVFQSDIDSNTWLGSLTKEQKKEAKQKLICLAKEYATAFYNQRQMKLNYEKERFARGLYYSFLKDPLTEAECVEQYVAIYKIFAYYWRLSLALEDGQEDACSLRHFGVDTSFLQALKNSIHLPCYNPQVADQLEDLITFFTKSYPASNVNQRTLLAIGSWGANDEIILPLNDLDDKLPDSECFGEKFFLEHLYQRIPEEAWQEVDADRERLLGWNKPDLKKWRLSHLFAFPHRFLPPSISLDDQPYFYQSLQLYSDLREMAMICWLFKKAPQMKTVEFTKVQWGDKKKLLTGVLKADPQVASLIRETCNAQDPSQVGSLAHSPIGLDFDSLKARMEQNAYLIEKRKGSHPFFDMAHLQQFSLYRLVSFYKESVSDLKKTDHQLFFQLLLFGQDTLRKTLLEDRLIVLEIVQLLDIAIAEFELELQADPSKEEVLKALLFVHATKLRLNLFVPGIVDLSQRDQLQQQISKQLQDLTTSSSTSSRELQGKAHPLKASTRSDLMLLWICSQDPACWQERRISEQVIEYLAQVQFLDYRLASEDESIDPTLKAWAYQLLIEHVEQIKAHFTDPASCFPMLCRIFDAYGIKIPHDQTWQGSFPQFATDLNGYLFEIDLLSGVVLKDKVALAYSSPIILNPTFNEFSQGRTTRLEISLISRSDSLSQWYALSDGQHYHFLVETDSSHGEKTYKSQIDLIRENETFSYIPFNEVPDSLKKIALPDSPKKEKYYFWINKRASEIAAIIQNRRTGLEEVVIYSDGSAKRRGMNGRWIYLPVERFEELHSLLSMQHKDQVVCVADVNDPLRKEVICYGLKITKEEFLKLSLKDEIGWSIEHIPGYHLSNCKVVKGIGRHFPYLVIENAKGQKKALIAVKTWSEVVSESTNPEKTFPLEEIHIDEKDNLVPADIKQHLLLAYQFLGAKQYDRALSFLKKAEVSRVYTPEELKLLGWICLHDKETHDTSPKALSIALIAGRLAKQNLDTFPDQYVDEAKEDPIKDFDASPMAWAQFWKGRIAWKNGLNEAETIDKLLGMTYVSYLGVSALCVGGFQIHDQLLTAFEEAEWIKEMILFYPHPQLIHRLHFLNTKEIHPIVSESAPHVSISFKFSDTLRGFTWIENLGRNKSSDQEMSLRRGMRGALSHLSNKDKRQKVDIFSKLARVRPDSMEMRSRVAELYDIAKNGSDREKQRLHLFLMDMQHDPEEMNQFIRAILMSQLPFYQKNTKGDNTRSSSKDKTVSEEIHELLHKMSESSHTGLGTSSGYFKDEEQTLVRLVRRWCDDHFPQQVQPSDEETSFSNLFQTSHLLPVLPEKKMDKMTEEFSSNASDLDPYFQEVLGEFFQTEENLQKDTSFPPVPERLAEDPFFQMRAEALREDIEIGKQLNQDKVRFCLKQGKSITSSNVHDELLTKRRQLKTDRKQRKKEIDLFVSQVRGGKSREIQARLLRLGKKEKAPSLDECIALFAQRDLKLYQNRLPFLSLDDCKKLHRMVGEYLLAATAEQKVVRTLEQLTTVIRKENKGKSQDEHLHLLASEMAKKREFVPQQYPEMLIFEYYANISLRQDQCDNFIKMITTDKSGKFPPLLIQMIMSGGKTFVLGTLLALIKADGYHLSLLLTPRSLLDTNVAEMKERTKTFFGQRGRILTFNRGEQHFNLPHLSKLHHNLLEAIEKRQYFMLSPETLLSMQNQYIEARERIYILRNKQISATSQEYKRLEEEIQKLQKPTQELKKILRLIRQRAAVTFDEIDAQYSPRKELNYPGVETTRLDRISVELVSKLYEIAATDPSCRAAGLLLTENTQSKMLPSQVDQVKPILVKKMVEAIQSNPLWCEHLGIGILASSETIADLTAYLLDPTAQVPAWIANLHNSSAESSQIAAERIILIRQEIQQWLPSCWKYSAQEHFSRSKEHPDYLAAKPNICASTPNESAEIAHAWELVNKTLQLYVSCGVDLKQTQKIISSLQQLALFQLRTIGSDLSDSGPSNSHLENSVYEKTPAAQIFRRAVEQSGDDLFLQQVKLMELDVKDEETMKRVQKVLNGSSNEAIQLIIQYLSDSVFSNLEFHKDQIHNTTANLSGAVCSEQGYSGTPENEFIFSLAYLQDRANRILLDKGANGRVIDKLCSNNRVLHTVDSQLKAPQDLMKSIHAVKPVKEQNQFHAFIDIGAYFKGYSNLEVAKSFLNYFSTLEETQIKGILYYDDKTNQLACLKMDQRNDPILIPSTDSKAIFGLSGLKREQLFTYFDQFHTVGANIIQVPDATAFYTIGDQTVLRDLLQGSMRMRSLLETQRVEGVVPQDLMSLMSYRIEQEIQTTPTIEQVLAFCEVNGLVRDREDNLRAFLVKLNASVRKYLFDKFYVCSLDQEEKLYAASRQFFIKSMQEQLFSLYANPAKPISSKDYIATTMQAYFEMLKAVEPFMPHEEFQALCQELHQIAALAASYIPSQIDTFSETQNTTVEKICDTTKQKQLDQQMETNLESQTVSNGGVKPKPAKEIPWNFNSLEAIQEQLQLSLAQHLGVKSKEMSQEIKLMSLIDLMNSNADFAIFSEAFSEQLHLSRNYLQTAEGGFNLFDDRQKSAYEALLFTDEKQQHHLVILSSEEAKGFYKLLRKISSHCFGLALLNADGSVRIGDRSVLNNEKAQNLIVQMLFFSGRFYQLQDQKWKMALQFYLSQKRSLKRDLFEAILVNVEKLQEYNHSILKKMLNAPSHADEVTNPLFAELKAAFFALKRRNFDVCRQVVEKHWHKIQKGHPEELSIVVDIAVHAAKSGNMRVEAQWGKDQLLKVLPLLKGYALEQQFKPLEKMIGALSQNISKEINAQILKALLEIPSLPEQVLIELFRNSSHIIVSKTTTVEDYKEDIVSNLKLLQLLRKYPSGKKIFQDAVLQFKTMFYPRSAISHYGSSTDDLDSVLKFLQSISLLLRESEDPEFRELLFNYSKEGLVSFFDDLAICRCSLNSSFGSQNPSGSEIKVIAFYKEAIRDLMGIYPQLDALMIEKLINPLIQQSHKILSFEPRAYSETEGGYDWEKYVETLKETGIPYAMEQAENLALKFHREYRLF